MFDKLPITSKTEKILTKSLDEEISVEEANYLMNIKGSDLYENEKSAMGTFSRCVQI